MSSLSSATVWSNGTSTDVNNMSSKLLHGLSQMDPGMLSTMSSGMQSFVSFFTTSSQPVFMHPPALDTASPVTTALHNRGQSQAALHILGVSFVWRHAASRLLMSHMPCWDDPAPSVAAFCTSARWPEPTVSQATDGRDRRDLVACVHWLQVYRSPRHRQVRSTRLPPCSSRSAPN